MVREQSSLNAGREGGVEVSKRREGTVLDIVAVQLIDVAMTVSIKISINESNS